MPENSGIDWQSEFLLSVQENFIFRIGNYTLLEDDKNRDCGTRNFSEKKAIYHTSQYALSREIKADVWTPNTLDRRQVKLADFRPTIRNTGGLKRHRNGWLPPSNLFVEPRQFIIPMQQIHL
ncbi:HNH endonuclease family protein [Spirosoma linguale]|uniref:HNH endonuclease family protein n=1 Tax=Spirosoma linguale TaxID=108 RepID=UPI003CC7EF78